MTTSEKQKNSRPKQKAPKTAFKPGVSGNPKGRPKKDLAISDILRNIANEVGEDGKEKKQAMLEKVINKALEGDKWAIEFYADRTEGKPKQSIEQINVDVDAGNWDKDKETSEEYINRVLSSNK